MNVAMRLPMTVEQFLEWEERQAEIYADVSVTRQAADSQR